MAFDSTNPADLAALKAEYQNDPAPAQGYRAPVDFFAQGSVAELTSLVNSAATSGAETLNGAFSGEDYVNAISGDDGSKFNERLEVLAADPSTLADIGNAASAQASTALANEAHARRAAALVSIEFFAGYRQLEVPEKMKTSLLGLWTGLSAGNDIRQALIAAGTRPLTRAEELFGDGTVITNRDTELALAYTP